MNPEMAGNDKAPGQEAELRKLSYEAAIEELERIVSLMERGSLTLDQSLAAFRRGTSLAQHCRARLDEVEESIRQLVEAEDGSTVELPLDEEGLS
ncbi:MAG: exodeoxyribonuclease VII small subunit [Bacillota bacterium]|nr:exodeoxyribonuclease VII small subunit [Bacillota bacterium]